MNIQNLTRHLTEGKDIGTMIAEIEGAANEMMTGEATPVQMASFLTALRCKGETPEVVAAMARVMRNRATPFKNPGGTVVDTCGTGGDHSGTFNISTTAAFVAAGAGVVIAKHGNRGMSSKCGSADVLGAMGIQVDCEPAVMEKALAEIGICFLFAQCYHTSMKHVAPVRRELGFRTVFNLLGPLSNPAAASHQLLGVFGKEPASLIAEVLNLLQTNGALVVHGTDGLDEITLTGKTHVYHVHDGIVEEMMVDPRLLGMELCSQDDLLGGEAEENARILQDILNGATGPKTDVVLLNAGATIYVCGMAPSISQGVEMARQSIASGAAAGKLDALRRLSAEAATGATA